MKLFILGAVGIAELPLSKENNVLRESEGTNVRPNMTAITGHLTSLGWRTNCYKNDPVHNTNTSQEYYV